MNVNAEKCLSNGGTTPLGYRIENKHYVLDEQRAPIVREIFQKYASGWSMKKICDDLNARQLKTAQGASFNKNSLHTMLKNRKYLGIYIYNGIEQPGGMPQIIDKELFEKVQDTMRENKKAPARARAKAEYILSGKLFCGYCKNGMVGISARKKTNTEFQIYNYYKCKTALHQKTCKKKTVRKEYIEDIVISECKRILTKPNIKRIAKEVVKMAQSMEDNSEIKRLELKLKELEDSKDNQMGNLRLCKDNAVRNMILEDLSKLAADIKAAAEQLEREKSRHYLVTEDQVISYLSQLVKGDISNLTYRRTLVRLFINKIFLYDDKLIITFTTGDEEVTIEDKLFDRIESDFSGDNFCISNVVGHHRTANQNWFAVFLFEWSKGRGPLPYRSSALPENPLQNSLQRVFMILLLEIPSSTANSVLASDFAGAYGFPCPPLLWFCKRLSKGPAIPFPVHWGAAAPPDPPGKTFSLRSPCEQTPCREPDRRS